MKPGEADPFGQVLQSIAADERRGGGGPNYGYAHPLAGAAAPFAAGSSSDLAPGDLWDHAAAWLGDEPARAPPQPESPPALSDDPESIAGELGLAEARTLDDLNRARRQFMWRHHPDRNPETAPTLATRRVAIANMLLDRAAKRLSMR